MNIFDLTDTWNAGATTFTAIKMNVTDTASAAGSLLIDLQVGGASQFSVTKAGVINNGTLALSKVTGFGTGVATFLATPSSANLASAVTDETGSGALVFGTSPTLSSPTLTGTIAGTPSCSGIWTWNTASAFQPQLIVQNTNTDAFGPYLVIAKLPSDDSLSANDTLGNIILRGKDTGGAARDSINITSVVVTQGAANVKSKLIFLTSQSTPLDSAEMTIDGGVILGNPTGGAKGVGTLNATAVYDDNVLLTCYVIDAALDGRVDMAKWDAKVPNRIIPAKTTMVDDTDAALDQEGNYPTKVVELEPEAVEERIHKDARKFASRLGTEYDPLNIDAYAAHWKTKRHLTSMPNEERFDHEAGLPAGTWIQRLIETVEIQAVHIETLNQRLKILEAQLSAV